MEAIILDWTHAITPLDSDGAEIAANEDGIHRGNSFNWPYSPSVVYLLA
jgi:hypothetical protein